jgi:hypothetical protein
LEANFKSRERLIASSESRDSIVLRKINIESYSGEVKQLNLKSRCFLIETFIDYNNLVELAHQERIEED